MEILLGMIILLQVLALIQLMLVYKQMLQRMNSQSEKTDAILQMMQKRMRNGDNADESKEPEASAEEILINTTQKAAQETLINEVLSEVFS
ncbi:MAG: hypothetical protein IJZ23_11150 [Roseburia sp.]|nr:hypothetical protein [Roseburia sp.]